MPRIKDYSLATATASDEFLVIDGSTNGTRKLNAYSPTFGGNLTVSGGTATVSGSSGYLKLTSTGASKTWDLFADSGGSFFIAHSGVLNALQIAPTTGNATLAGNLTVSGGQTLTVGSSANYSLWKDGTPTKAGRVILNTTVTNGLSLGLYDGSSWVDTLHIHPTNNNVLIGTTTDGGQKLQVSGTATFKNFTGATGILVNSDNTSATNYPVVQLMHSNPAGYGGRMAVDQNGYTLFQYQSNGGAWTDWLQLNSTTGNATFLSGILSVSVAAGSRDYLFNLATNDQAAARLRFTNSGSGGKVWSLVGGNPGANNADFTIYDESNALKALVLKTGTGDATFAGSVKAASEVYAEKSGAGFTGQSTGLITQVTTVNSTTYNVTTGSAKVFVVQLASGDAALCYASYKSSTITILGSDGTIVNSSSPDTGQLGIYKSANNHVISFKTGSNALAGGYASWGFCFLGNPVISIA